MACSRHACPHGWPVFVMSCRCVISVFLVISGINMACGTVSYIFYTTKLRKKFMFSSTGWFFTVAMATLHFLLWLGAIAVYQGFVEEEYPEEVIIMEPVENDV